MKIGLSAGGLTAGRPLLSHPGISFDFLARRFAAGAAGGAVQRSANALDFMSFTTAAKYTRMQSGALGQSVANAPAYDWSASGVPLGLLVEGANTNLALRSSELNLSPWLFWQCQAFGSGSVVDADVAPDGTTTAERVTENATSNSHAAYQSITWAVGTYTASCFVKRPTTAARDQFSITSFAPGGAFVATFNLVNGTVSGTAGTGVTARITPFSNGWFRCEMTFTVTGAGAAPIEFGTALAGGTRIYLGDGASGLLMWGAQVETGAVASSYIPTAGSAVTRAADTITHTASAGTFATSVGTVVAEVQARQATPGFGEILSIGGVRTLYHWQGFAAGTGDGTTLIDAGTGTMIGNVTRHGSQWGGAPGNLRATARFTASVLSATAAFDGAMGAGATLSIGGGTDRLNGWIRRLDVWPTRLTDAEIQAMVA
jgi:hypothetical protein